MPAFAMRQEAWNKFNSYWDTFRFKRRSAIMRSRWLCRVVSVSACQSDHFSWITAHKIS
jgi:hypothetical protein